MTARNPVPRGTPDLLVLRTLAREPLHGWRIPQRPRHLSNDLSRVREGA
jgi:hypothetical protein